MTQKVLAGFGVVQHEKEAQAEIYNSLGEGETNIRCCCPRPCCALRPMLLRQHLSCWMDVHYRRLRKSSSAPEAGSFA